MQWPLSVTAVENSAFRHVDLALEVLSVAVFTVEYVLRVWSCVEDPRYAAPCRGRLRWAAKPLSLFDLVSLVPFAINTILRLASGNDPTSQLLTLKILSLLRIAAVLRLERQSKSFKRLVKVFRSAGAEMSVSLFLTSTSLLLVSSLLYVFEYSGPCGDQFQSIFAALETSVSILSTVGFSEIGPCTIPGKILVAVAAFLGVVLFALPAAILGSTLIAIVLEERQASANERHARRASADSFSRSHTASSSAWRVRRNRGAFHREPLELQSTVSASAPAALGSPDDDTQHSGTIRTRCPNCDHSIELQLSS